MNTITGWVKISQGGTAGTVVEVKIIAKYAIDSLSNGVILVHNHPSGNTKPSDSDKDITNKVKNALELFEIKVLDHIIVTEANYYSFADEGII
jgi:DNA repair protein RadC